ncbi:MAG: hypothetical protein ORN85_08150, partial [Sediminibacterium sp.]|nr:hypothetical protein [Sediminibacterium sp.]
SKKYNFFENLKNGLGVFIITSIILIGINNMGIIYSTLQFGFLNFTSDTYPLGYSAVAEVRYFAPSLILLFILLIMSFLKLKNRIWRSLIGTFIILGFVFAFVINGVFLYSRLVKPLPKVPEYIHYKKNDLDIYQVLKNYNPENTRFFINKYSSLQTYYFARCAHIPIFSNYNLSLPLYSKSSLNIIGLVNATEDIYPEYQKEVLIKNIEPNIDLINIKINNN